MVRKSTKSKVSTSALGSLARYWYRADLMHEYLHLLRDEYDDLERLKEDGHWWEFETYLAYWLSGLFVLVEGINKAGLSGKNVKRLYNENLSTLKKVRHETYHYVEEGSRGPGALPGLNWAEELHEAIGEVIKQHVGLRAQVERLMEMRMKK